MYSDLRVLAMKVEYPMRTPSNHWFSSEEELQLFIDWVLSHAAKRNSRGKNPNEPIRGIWTEYSAPRDPKGRGKARTVSHGPAYMKRNDWTVRRYAAILALEQSGRSHKEACFDVGLRIYGQYVSPGKVSSIATGFAKFRKSRNPWREGWVNALVTGFHDWLNWEIKENLFDRGIRLHQLLLVMRRHAEWTWHDRRSALLFLKQYKILVLRAVVLLGERLETGVLQ